MRFLKGFWLSCCVFLVLTGCGFGEEHGSTDAQTPEETRAQYWEEAAKLSLAPGWKWPPRTPEGVGILDTDLDDGAGNTYSPGYGRSWANDYWFCSWQGRLLEEGLSSEERAQALSTAKKIRQTHRYKNAVDENGRRQYEDMFGRAELGDLSVLRADFKTSCQSKRNP